MIKILLVDDDYLALEGLCQMLPWDDFNGELSGCATDGIEAISMIEDNPPDVVVADIKMPRMNRLHSQARDPAEDKRAGNASDENRQRPCREETDPASGRKRGAERPSALPAAPRRRKNCL